MGRAEQSPETKRKIAEAEARIRAAAGGVPVEGLDYPTYQDPRQFRCAQCDQRQASTFLGNDALCQACFSQRQLERKPEKPGV